MTVYLDCNATTPIEPEVRDIVVHYMVEEFGNAGSRTHEFGARAQQAVQRARDQIAAVVRAKRDEVIFTSGATESNNLAILGLVPHGEQTGRKHVVSTAIEHKAVLEPLDELSKRGFEVTLVRPTPGGWVDPEAVAEALRPETLLVSVMHVNNETGVVQPIQEISGVLSKHPAYFHVDAAQGFGKEFNGLQSNRIDLLSVSGHKIYAPKGIGALIARRRGYDRIPLTPLMFGGGQERGLRPGTLPVHLIVGLGAAAEIAGRDVSRRHERCTTIRRNALESLKALNPTLHGDQPRTLPHVLSLSFPGVDSEALMLALKGVVAVSNGSACTSHAYAQSHVLHAMGVSSEVIQGAIRLSWCHLSADVDWRYLAEKVRAVSTSLT